MTKFYKELEYLPQNYHWRDKIVTLPGIKKDCVGYFYLLALIELASKNPYASLHELYMIGLAENTFDELGTKATPSYNNIYTGITYALKEVPDDKKPKTLKKYVNQAAMDLLLLEKNSN